MEHFKIMCYVPNLIGYMRFVLNTLSIFYAYNVHRDGKEWETFLVLYSSSMLLDAFDGMAARKLNQCSKFGASLDMVADRTSCATIHLVLIAVYPQPLYNFCFMMFFVVDFGSHFL